MTSFLAELYGRLSFPSPSSIKRSNFSDSVFLGFASCFCFLLIPIKIMTTKTITQTYLSLSTFPHHQFLKIQGVSPESHIYLSVLFMYFLYPIALSFMLSLMLTSSPGFPATTPVQALLTSYLDYYNIPQVAP